MSDRHRPPGAPEPGTAATVDLLDLLTDADAELLAAHGRWYLAERDPRYLRRNALVALGNVGDGADPATGRRPRPLDRSEDAPAGRARPVGGRSGSAARTWSRRPVAPVVTHLLVTNDFPPKVGGIQAYLWELWRRLDPSTRSPC